MMRWIRPAAFGLALVIALFALLNASWLAPEPVGAVKLIAHRGIYQQFSHKDLDPFRTCTASRIEPPINDYLENTVRSMQAAARIGADMVEMDVAPTADGQIAIFHDWTLDCRTEGKGEVRNKTLAELKALDIGHGYTADGGRTFQFRGRRQEVMPSLDEALAALPATPILFNFKSKDPREADQLAAALAKADRNVELRGDAFYGSPGPVERIKHYYPKAWAWSLEAAKRCSKDYLHYAWTSVVPESCRNGTLILPLNYQWLAWGWPNRLLDRMKGVGARVIVTGPNASMGLNLPEQLGEIPSSFKGYVWVEDIWTVGPGLRPQRDFRTEAQRQAAETALERRRAAD